MVWLVVSIPASAVLMGAIMLYLAVSTFDGLVTDDYYREGLHINRSMERDERAEAYGLSSLVAIDAGGGAVEILLEGGDGFAAPEIVNLRLFHATRPGLDLHIRVRRRDDGRYVAGTAKLAPGRWYVQIDADDWRLKGELAGGEGAVRVPLGRAAAKARK